MWEQTAVTQPPALRIPVRTVIAIILVLVFALFVRAYIQLELRALDFEVGYAKDLSYLAVSPIFVLMLLPLVRDHEEFWSRVLDRNRLTVRLVLSAVALGVVMRILWWSQLIARVSFGLTRNHDPTAVVGPEFSFACPQPQVIGLGLLVMALLVPVVEEFLDRGVLQSAFVHKGKPTAILVSAVIFTAFHTPSSYAFVFVMGVVLGLQFWNTQTLWASMITHGSYNGLIQFDWRCLRGTWNPTAEQLPVIVPGSIAITVLIAATACALWLLKCYDAGASPTPRHS